MLDECGAECAEYRPLADLVNPLVISEAGVVAREQVVALERAGVDAIVVGAGIAFGRLPGGEKEIVVRAAPVRRSSMPVIVRVTGEFSPGREAIIVSRLAGKVTAVHFNVGDAVPAGTVGGRIAGTKIRCDHNFADNAIAAASVVLPTPGRSSTTPMRFANSSAASIWTSIGSARASVGECRRRGSRCGC